MLEFLSPVSDSVLAKREQLPAGTLGKHIAPHTDQEGLPEMVGVKVAIIGVKETRSVLTDAQQSINFDSCRNALYSLYPGNWDSKIIDLGDIDPGNTPEDSRFALKEIVASLIKSDIIPLILGAGQNMAYAQYRAYDNLDQMVNVVNVDYRFDIGDADLPISNKSHVGKMIVEQPYNLFSYAVLGYQSFFNSPEEISLMEKLFFDAYRLGEITADVMISEPVLRNADMVIFDATAIKSSEMSYENNNNPNGFDGREICALARYAGISNQVTSFGVYELGQDITGSSAMLIGQILWYFIEGVNFRISEDFENESLFTTYVVPLDGTDLIFKKSHKSERWWMELPFFSNNNNKTNRHTLLPCTYVDYIDACNHKIPERWMRARIKNEGKL